MIYGKETTRVYFFNPMSFNVLFNYFGYFNLMMLFKNDYKDKNV